MRERGIGGVKIFPATSLTFPPSRGTSPRCRHSPTHRPFRIPLLISTDQEGGWVRQIKGETSLAPGNLALGASASPSDALWTGYYLGRELAALGINMNFAPTADVYANPDASVIGPRSFGSDPALTGLLSAAYAKGMRKAGVLCTAKHFPGHGSADKDSHGKLPVISARMAVLARRDLLPYRILAREGIAAIMSGHLAFPGILGTQTPASLSSFFMHSVLRDGMGFTGMVITDDMEMEGALGGGIDTATACRRALEAGNDIVLVSHTPAVQERTWRALRSHMKADAAFRRVVRASVTRILQAKLSFFADESAATRSPTPSGARRAIPAPGARDFFFQSSSRSVTQLKGGRLPWRPSAKEKVLLVGQFPEFLEEGARRFPGSDTAAFPFMPFYHARAEDRARLVATAARYDTIVFCLANFNSLAILEAMKPLAERIIVISALSPVLPRAGTVGRDGDRGVRERAGLLQGGVRRARRRLCCRGTAARAFRGRCRPMSWRPASGKDSPAILKYLLADETLCVPLTSRIRSGCRGCTLYFDSNEQGLVSDCLLFSSAGLLLPAFSSPPHHRRELAHLLARLRPSVQSIMGITRCVEEAEALVPTIPTRRIEYFLMRLSRESRPAVGAAPSPGQ